MLAKGTVLCSVDSQRYTNAIVVKSDLDMTTVLSDFGNEMQFKTEMLFEHYTISNAYIQALAIGYPVDSITDRIQKQIELLEAALEKYEN